MFGAEFVNKKAVALLSGGLDSTLAVCILKEQGISIHAVNFQTMFGCCKEDARRVAHRLGVEFSLLKVDDDYLEVIQNPRHGYGRGINPCVDCRAYMFSLARKLMEELGASFVVSGEVLGQRPMSQKMSDFRIIDKESGLEGKVLRPLSAKLLAPTEPEKAGIVDRSRFYGIQGRSRHELLALAGKYGIENPPSPSPGCALTQPAFAVKVRDVFRHSPGYRRWEFEVLRLGRHFRLSPSAKAILARNENEAEYLKALHPEGTSLLQGVNFAGPVALLVGEADRENLSRMISLMLRYADKPLPSSCEIRIQTGNGTYLRQSVPDAASREEVEALRIA